MKVKVARASGEELSLDVEDGWSILDLAKSSRVSDEPWWNQRYSLGVEVLDPSTALKDVMDPLSLRVTVVKTACLATSTVTEEASTESFSFNLWSLETGKLIESIASDSAADSMSLDLSQDGRQLLVGHNDGSARLFSFEERKMIQHFRGAAGAQANARLSANGSKLLVTAGIDAEVWSLLDQATCFSRLSGHTAPVISAEFAKDEKSVLTVSQDGTAKVFTLAAGEATCSLTLRSDKGDILSASFSADSTSIHGNISDGSASSWDAGTGECKVPFKPPSKGKGKGKSKQRFNFPIPSISPAGGKNAITAVDGQFALCDTCNNIVFDFGIASSHVFGISPDGRWAWFRNREDTDYLELWTLPANEGRFGVLDCCNPETVIHCRKAWSVQARVDADRLIFSPDSSLVLYVPYFDDDYPEQPLWDTKSGCSRKVSFPEPPRGFVEISHDNKCVVSIDRGVTVYSLDTGSPLGAWEDFGDARVMDVSLPSAVGWFLVVTNDRQARIFNMCAELLQRVPLPAPEGHSHAMFSASLSPDRRLALTSSFDALVKVWSTATGKCLQTLTPRSEDFTPFIDAGSPKAFGLFTHDGSKVVTLSASESDENLLGLVKLWSALDGTCLKTLDGSGQQHTPTAFLSMALKLILPQQIYVKGKGKGGKGGEYRYSYELFDLESGTAASITSPDELFRAAYGFSPPYWIFSERMLLSPSGRLMLTGSNDNCEGMLAARDGSGSALEIKLPPDVAAWVCLYHVQARFFSQDELHLFLRSGFGADVAVFSTTSGRVVFSNPEGISIRDAIFNC